MTNEQFSRVHEALTKRAMQIGAPPPDEEAAKKRLLTQLPARRMAVAEEMTSIAAQLAGTPSPSEVHSALCLIYARGHRDGVEAILTRQLDDVRRPVAGNGDQAA